MSEIQGVGRFRFHEGKVEEFKRLAAQCMDIVRAKDTGIEHGKHVAEVMGAIFATGFGLQPAAR